MTAKGKRHKKVVFIARKKVAYSIGTERCVGVGCREITIYSDALFADWSRVNA
jgi:hypothetical protein